MKQPFFILSMVSILFLITPKIVQAQGADMEGIVDLVCRVIVDIEVDPQPFRPAKAIEWEYQTVLESQRMDNYTLLLEPTSYNYEQVRIYYLQKKKQRADLLDKIAYVDRFYNHQLPNEIVPNTIHELRQVLALAPTIQDEMPRQLLRLLAPYRDELTTYHQLGIRTAEIALLLEQVDQLEKKLRAEQPVETLPTIE